MTIGSVTLLMEDYRGTYTAAVREAQARGRRTFDELSSDVFSRSIFYGDAYISAFESSGVTATQVVPNCVPLQQAWASEHGIHKPPALLARRPARWLWTRRGKRNPVQEYQGEVVRLQLESAPPDVAWVFSGVSMTREDVESWRQFAGSIALWWSCAIVESTPFGRFDLVLSSIEPLVVEFRRRGLRAELMHHAFDGRVLFRIAPSHGRRPRVAFVGNLTRDHRERIRFLDAFSRRVELDFYGLGVELLPLDSPMRARWSGPAWGDDLYRVYGDYELVIHKNIDVAAEAPSAKRLFEVTGMGACLLTERSDRLSTLFQPETEVLAYSNLDEAVALAQTALADLEASRSVAAAGQRRTLSDHTYDSRVAQFLSYL